LATFLKYFLADIHAFCNEDNQRINSIKYVLSSVVRLCVLF